jgi:sec-independent protein translocase protein TatB
MLDVGFSEILLTSAIALIVLGPERLPKVARQVGNWVGRARVMARQLSEQLEREVNAEELLKAQLKPNAIAKTPAAGTANSGAAFDPSYTPTIAPATVSTPPPGAYPHSAESPPPAESPPSAESPPAAESAPAAESPPAAAASPSPSAPHPVYGLAASATTAAAMHAADPVDPPPTHE